jgi:hypothetical protein
MLNRYDVGDLVRFPATFKNYLEELTDPNTIRFRYVKPDGTATTLQFGVDGDIIRDSVGEFHIDLELDTKGEWQYNWISDGAVITSQWGILIVEGRAL